MALQLINLGTPNNNDGDSLYAGGSKINSNFSELYTQLAGANTNALRIDLGTGPGFIPTTGSVLTWSVTNQKFIATSGAMRSAGLQGSSALILTNDNGRQGVDLEYTSRPNALEFFINGRRLWDLRATTTGSITGTRATWYIGLGNAAVTSLAITTRGVSISGVDGLTVWKNTAEENIASSQLIGTGSSGIILYQSPLIDRGSQKGPTDSSNAIAHTGFVQALLALQAYAAGTTTITGNRGVTGGGTLTTNRNLQLDPRAMYNFCNGLTYQFQYDTAGANGATSVLVVHPGTAVHYSYSTTGATQVATTSVQSIVTTTQSIARAWLDSPTWTPTNSSSLLEASVSLAAYTWFYVYLIVHNTTGVPDICVSTSRSYAAAQTKLTAATGGSPYVIVRRLGAFRNGAGASGPQPFTTRRIDNNTIKLQYGDFQTFSPNTQSSSYTSSVFIQTGSLGNGTLGIFSSSAGTTATANLFSSTLITAIPPIPGITADIDVYYNISLAMGPAQTTALTVIFYGEPWLSSTSTTYWSRINTGVPYQKVLPTALFAANNGYVGLGTGIVTTVVATAPDHAYVPDAALDVNTVFGSTSGVILRYGLFNQQINAVSTNTPTHLGWDVRGFNIAR